MPPFDPSPSASHIVLNATEVRLLDENGELMTGTSLRRLLHMKHERAFRRAMASGRLPVSVFQLPGRKGWFARTRDVAAWLVSLDTVIGGFGKKETPVPPRVPRCLAGDEEPSAPLPADDVA
jgi:hypothetical protein